jgi:hypothetical protein
VERIEDGRLLRIFIGESDQLEGRPMYEAILELLRRRGLAGATVVRGIAGFGRSSVVHTAGLLRMSADLPIIIEVVDTAERLAPVIDELDTVIDEGLMTLERVEVHVYRGRSAT